MIAWLANNVAELQQTELEPPQLPVPCPANAYPGTPERFIADTPSMRAALADKSAGSVSAG